MTKVSKVHNELYLRAIELAKADGISMADAITRLVEQGGAVPTACQLSHFDKVLREQGLTPPRRPDWVWGVTDVLPAEMLQGTKLEPYARARTEAELRCTLGDELYDKLIVGQKLMAGELTAEEEAELAAKTAAAAASELTAEEAAEIAAEPEPEAELVTKE